MILESLLFLLRFAVLKNTGDVLKILLHNNMYIAFGMFVVALKFLKPRSAICLFWTGLLLNGVRWVEPRLRVSHGYILLRCPEL